MSDLLLTLGRMSLTAGLTALAVLVLRALLIRLKAPAFLRLLLWAVVLFRMVCPVSFTSVWSPASLLAAVPEPVEQAAPAVQTEPVAETARPVQEHPIPATPEGETPPEDVTVEYSAEEPAVTDQKSVPVLELLWLAGAAALWVWFWYQQRRLKRAMDGAVRVAPGVWESDRPGPPFVLGIVRPRIYLPAGLEEPHRSYVLAHERTHLRRGDFLWKPLFFLAVSIHWFNPVLWLAWRLFCRDLEASCDEGVLRTLPEGEKGGYARALLRLAAPDIPRLPAAFGEHDVSRRVKGALSYRKPALVLVIVLAAVAAGVGLWLCSNPAESSLPEEPPALTVDLDWNSVVLTADGWDGDTPPDPAALLENAPRFVDDSAWSHGASVSFGGGPYPDEGVFTDYLLQGEEWVAGHSAGMTFSMVLNAREDSDGTGYPEERGVVFTYTWKEGFTKRSATYAFRVAVPSVQPDQEWTEPIIYAGGIPLQAYDETFCSDFYAVLTQMQDQDQVVGIPMDSVITINDPTVVFQSEEARLYLLTEDGLELGHHTVGGSGGGGGEYNRSSSGFPINAADRGWPEDEYLLLGLEVTYTWADGSTSTFRSVFRAVPEGLDLLDTLPRPSNGEATLLWQEGALALAAVSRPNDASVYHTGNGGLDWTVIYSLPQPPYRDTIWDALSITAQGDQLVMERKNRDTGEIQQLYSDRTYAVNWTAREPIADLEEVRPEDIPAYSATEWPDTWGIDPVVRLWPDPMWEDTTGVTVCVCSYDVSGRSEMGVLVDGVFSWFDTGAGEYGLYGQHAWAVPQWADLDGDGTDELLITRYDGQGTGIILQALHVLEPEGDGHYTLTASFSLNTEGTTDQVDALLGEMGLEGLYCGMACTFPSTFTVALGVCDSNSEYFLDYCGTLTCTLVYDGHSITLADPDYTEDS